MKNPETLLTIDAKAVYRVCVQGRIEECQSEWLGGMVIQFLRDNSGYPVTTLMGELPDQAALFGVINTLYNHLRLPILSVECLQIFPAQVTNPILLNDESSR